MSLPSLSPELWQRIMEHTDQDIRARASAVSKAMQAAAVAAMTAVDVYYCGIEKLDFLRLWLPKYGQHVTSFKAEGGDDYGDTVLAELPCPRLQELKLSFDIPVLLGSSARGPGVLQGCPGLTNLHLVDSQVLDDDGLEGISVLTALKELNLKLPSRWHVDTEEDSSEEDEEENTSVLFPGSVLQHCSRLTYLYLSMAASGWQYLSCLNDLQELYFDTLSHITHSTLPGGLPTSLRALRCSIDVLDPALLSTLTNMQRLDIGDYEVFRLEGGAAGDALLRAITPLQQLEALCLSRLECEWPAMSSDHPALTASSSLTKLSLWNCSLPAWQHVFAPGRMLQSIYIYHAGDCLVTPVAVKQLVACCPKLQDLRLSCTLSPIVDVTLLGQLSALTALHASYHSVSNAGEACQVLQQFACLTQLTDLDLSFSSCEALEVSALLPLTALWQLTHLKCTPPWGVCQWGNTVGSC